MPAEREIRANFDESTIVVYQAYSPRIARPAVEQQRFVSPFSFRRMTWLKPSFLWLMHRSNWGRKRNQERTLAVRVTRDGWDRALSLAVLTHPEPRVFPTPAEWEGRFREAPVYVQWDTERSLRGAALNHFSIQVGIGRDVIREFVDEWIVGIEDVTQTVVKIRNALRAGRPKQAKRQVPRERVYRIDEEIARGLDLG